MKVLVSGPDHIRCYDVVVKVVVRVDAVHRQINVERKHCQRRYPADRGLDHRGEHHIGQGPARLGDDLIAGPEDFDARPRMRAVRFTGSLDAVPRPRTQGSPGHVLGALCTQELDPGNHGGETEESHDEPST